MSKNLAPTFEVAYLLYYAHYCCVIFTTFTESSLLFIRKWEKYFEHGQTTSLAIDRHFSSLCVDIYVKA
jgi:hypothetical protein